ncbi:unnamed protein product [Cuscuta campestris]|uniref:Pentacotripeptide-repeat region of PRORP domain-containing protein n=1 Tax=Cuscuta campestris TaxID=132261 RepID=A0A484NI43_9ASTE|nr:unnamed protein product [Cuscuta campestris]
MKELGFALSPRPFNEIMRFNASKPADVLEVLAELKKSGVSPDNDSYRICISSFGLKYDLDGMERMLREMETQPHIVMDWCTYAVVAEFYDRGFLIDKANDALEKVRVMLQKKRRKPPNYLLETDYENVIKSLGKLGEFDEAMNFVKEWEILGNFRQLDVSNIPCTIIEEYIKNGKLQEAFYKIRAWSRTEKRGWGTFGIGGLSRLLCKEYIKVGNMFQAFNCFRETRHGFQVHPVVPMLFFKYLEEECGSFFPLRCTGSIKHVTGTIFSEANRVHHEYLTQASNMDYKNSIKSKVESGKLNEAMKMVTEWEASGNYDLNILKMIIEGYCKKSFFMEAEAMVEAWTREKRPRVSEIWFVLASQYQLYGKLVRGFECMKRCFALTPELKGIYGMMFWTFMNGIQYSRGMDARGQQQHQQQLL